MYAMERLRRGRWRRVWTCDESPVRRLLNRVLIRRGWAVTCLTSGERWESRHDFEGLVLVREGVQRVD